MIGLIFGETDFPKYIYRKIKNKKKYLIIDLTNNNFFKKDKNSHKVSIGQFGKIISILKKQNSLAIGNILGSNIANIFGITLISIFINGDINYHDLLSNIDKLLFLITSIIFFVIIRLRLAGKLISLALVLSYLAYFAYLYL